MDGNTLLGIVMTVVAVLLPLSFAVLAWKHTLSERRRRREEEAQSPKSPK